MAMKWTTLTGRCPIPGHTPPRRAIPPAQVLSLPWPCRCSRRHHHQEHVRVLGVMVSAPALVVEPVDSITYKAAKENISAPPSHPLSLMMALRAIRWCRRFPLGRAAVSSTRFVTTSCPTRMHACLKYKPTSQATSQSCPQAHRPQGRMGQARKDTTEARKSKADGLLGVAFPAQTCVAPGNTYAPMAVVFTLL